MNKTYINAQKQLEISIELALKVFESGFRPDYIVGVWRGGAPIGITVQEVLECLDVKSDHIAIRTSAYHSLGKRSRDIQVHGLNYLIKRLHSEESLLIVDDVYDTGLSIDSCIKKLTEACKKNTPEIRIATPYFKPENNLTEIVPDYYIEETNNWLVFPHSLEGLQKDEVLENKPWFSDVVEKMTELGKFS